MLNRLTKTSLCTLPLWLTLACGPQNLTVGDKDPGKTNDSAGGEAGAGQTDNTPGKVLPVGNGAGGDPGKGTGGASASGGKGDLPVGGAAAEATFFCADPKKLPIPVSSVCDTKKDCPDGSDEANCMGSAFSCWDKSRVDAVLVCNGKPDCPDGSDEFNCNPSITFCNDKSKIDSSLVCNGKPDCPDGSDELNCKPLVFYCGDKTALPAELVCNGKPECPDNSDEQNCGTGAFKCKSGETISASLECNGKAECADASDESNCFKSCKEGIDNAPRFDPKGKCLTEAEPIACAKLIQPEQSVPSGWPATQCLHRKLDGAIFLVPEPQLTLDWYDCTPGEVELMTLVGACP